jgi:hypothetical protein
MQFGVVALFLSAGTTALSQLAAPNPAKQGPTQPGIFLFQKEFAKAPDSQITLGGPAKLVIPPNLVLPNLAPPSSGGLRRENAQSDPKMIVHPPTSSIGNQPPGTAVAQNLYPGLQLLPIEKANAKGGPIPTTWPNLAVKQIPIVWPKFEVKPAESGTAAKTQAPTK